MREWQPIEDAPRDGTEVLLAEWQRNHYDPATDDLYDRWYIFVGKYSPEDRWECTEYDAFGHWPSYYMPKPEPPE